MSAQFAMVGMMVASTALTAAGQIEGANARASGMRSQALGMEVQKSEVEVQTAHREAARRTEIAKVISANEVDAGARGVALDPGSSFDVIQSRNLDAAEEDIKRIRWIGDSQGKRLSFAAQDMRAMADQSVNAAWLGAIGSIFKMGASAMGGMSGMMGGGFSGSYSTGTSVAEMGYLGRGGAGPSAI